MNMKGLAGTRVAVSVRRLLRITVRTVTGRLISEFFTPLDLTVKEMSGDEINEFYTYLRNAGLKGSTGQRYHGEYLQPPRCRDESRHRRGDE